MSIRVRRAVAEDVHSVRFIGISTWPVTYGPLNGPRYVTDGLDTYWSADTIRSALEAGTIDVAEGPHGLVGMTEVDELEDALIMWKLYVVPSQQGAGIGRRLVGVAKARARERGCDLLTEHEPENTAAGAFYAREGFTPTDAPWPGTNAVWLRWRVGPERQSLA